jgi:hypothetical protein
MIVWSKAPSSMANKSPGKTRPTDNGGCMSLAL